MKLGGGKTTKKDSLMAAMAQEDNFTPFSSSKNSNAFGISLDNPMAMAPAKPSTPAAPVTILLEEKITVQINREGGVESCDVKGTLNVTANTDQGQCLSIAINKQTLNAKCVKDWTINTHPKINKSAYEKQGILVPKDTKKGFPLNRQMGILRWAYAGTDAAPLTINCWPEDDGNGAINVNIEYEFVRPQMTLHDVNIIMPLGTSDPPAIESIDGTYKHDPHAGMLCWHFDQIDANSPMGSLEFAVAGRNPDAFFPITITFRSEDLLCPIEVGGVVSIADGKAVPNTMSRNVIPEAYQCA